AWLAGGMRVPSPATGMPALVTFGMWVPWRAASWAFGVVRGASTDCRSDIFVTIRVVKPAYIALMFIGPLLAGIRGHGPLLHCGLRPLMRGSAPASRMQGEVSPCEPLWPAFQLVLAEKFRLRQRIVRRVVRHDPCPVHPGMATGFFQLRAVTNGPGKTAAAAPD